MAAERADGVTGVVTHWNDTKYHAVVSELKNMSFVGLTTVVECY
jgi:hypothetical protein